MLRATLGAVLMCGLAACGGDPCDGGGGGFFSSADRAAEAAPALPTVTVSVLVDAGNTVIIELVTSFSSRGCSTTPPQTTRLVWDPARRTATATTAVPSSSARRVTGAMLGGGVTTWEEVVPGLTVRALTNQDGNIVLNFTSAGMSTVSVTCSTGFNTTCA
ncbi:MAG: hypothetical protein U0324_02815 [Polyangiales bacterium]